MIYEAQFLAHAVREGRRAHPGHGADVPGADVLSKHTFVPLHARGDPRRQPDQRRPGRCRSWPSSTASGPATRRTSHRQVAPGGPARPRYPGRRDRTTDVRRARAHDLGHRTGLHSERTRRRRNAMSTEPTEGTGPAQGADEHGRTAGDDHDHRATDQPAAVDRPRARSRPARSRRSRPPRPRAWSRSTRPRGPGSTQTVENYVNSLAIAGHALAGVREEDRFDPHDGRP